MTALTTTDSQTSLSTDGPATTMVRRWLAARWVRFLSAMLGGVLIAVSFPDYNLAPLIFVAFVPLILAAVTASGKLEAFFLGSAGYTVTWLINVPWVITVMSKYGGLPYPTGVALFVAMSIVLGLYGGLFTLFVHLIRPGEAIRWWFVIPFVWAAVEFGRTFLLTGFPWNLIAAAAVDLRPIVQVAPVFGPYGIGAMIVLFSTLLAWIVLVSAPGGKKIVVIGGLLVFGLLWWTTGIVLIDRENFRILDEKTYTAALLQPNIPETMKWDEGQTLSIFMTMTEMTDAAAKAKPKPDVIIWPESTVPVVYMTTPMLRDYVESISRLEGIDVILGSVAEDPRDPDKLWNSAYIVTVGTTRGRYDKIRLVPFGEYVPLRKMLFFARKLVHAVGNFQFGSNDRPLKGKFSYGPAICYEVVYPQITAQQVRNGADVLVTITNDGWFGETAAPRQHLNNARLRAIEDNRYLLRAATSGISAVVDPTGKIVQELPVGRKGTIMATFAPRHRLTAYVRFGDWFAILAAVLAVAAAVVRRRVIR
ncbi:MAG: apolipoprotein N-acyltransferase [Thermoanaerobaculia bacterium]